MAVRKVNLGELKGSLNQRGRSRFQDPDLLEAFKQMLIDHEPVVYDELFVVTNKTTDKELDNQKAKWRNRAVSVFDSLESGHKVSISWTTANEMIISLVQ